MFNRDLIIDCYTFDRTIFDLYKPQLANKFIPDGWKTMHKTTKSKAFLYRPDSEMEVETPTIKTCSGFIDLFSNGIIIPSWSDILIESLGEEVISMSPTNMAVTESHSRDQIWEELYAGYNHVKINSPWLFKTNNDTKFSWNRCSWHRTDIADSFHVMSGIVEYRYQHMTNIQAFVKGNIKINAGDPLVHIIPLSDKKIKLRYHLVEGKEFQSILGTKNLKYVGNYKERKAILSKKSCPFGFGK